MSDWTDQSDERMRAGLCEAINEAARIEASRSHGYRRLRSTEGWNVKEYRVREKITASSFRRLMQIRRLYRATQQQRGERGRGGCAACGGGGVKRLRRFWRRLWANPPTVIRIRQEIRDPSLMDRPQQQRGDQR